MFLYELNKHGVTIDRMKNKQGKVYGLKFSYGEHMFKASEVGREFGYRSLQKNFEAGKKADTNKSDQVIRKSSKHTDTKEAGYQLVPPSRSYSPPPTKETPKITQTIRDMADALVGGGGRRNDYTNDTWRGLCRDRMAAQAQKPS